MVSEKGENQTPCPLKVRITDLGYPEGQLVSSKSLSRVFIPSVLSIRGLLERSWATVNFLLLTLPSILKVRSHVVDLYMMSGCSERKLARFILTHSPDHYVFSSLANLWRDHLVVLSE